MHVIGGLAFWDAQRPVTAAQLQAMAGRAGAAGEVYPVGRGPAAFFSTGRVADLEERDRVLVVADADLLNLEELRGIVGPDLEGVGLFAALYAREGAGFVRRLQGAFALALFDRREGSLLLAVDQFGIKRLHYAAGPDGIAFASRPTAVLGAPGVETRVDPTQVFNYLNFGYVPAPGSIFAGLQRVPPGHVVSAAEGRVTPDRYWDMSYPERWIRRREAAAEVYRLTEEAVSKALRRVAAKEAGAFLSGGTDSSTIVGMMSRITGEQVNAFSIGFREERYDELGYARLAARHFGAAHHTKVVSPAEARAILPRMVDAYDEPFGNNSAIGTFFCADLARQCGTTTLLAGDGGDEIFGGNEAYRTDRLFARYRRVPAFVRHGLLEPLLRTLPDGGAGVVGRARRYVRRANIPNPLRFYSYEFFFAQEGNRLLGPDFLAACAADAPYRVIQEHYDRARASADLNRLLYLDLKLTIGDSDLFKVTRTAEMAGVTPRFPMLDPALVELTGTWPADLKVRGLEKRHLFKRAFRPLLPREIVGKRKHGFGVPASDWLKRDPGFRALAKDTLLSNRASARGYFRPGALAELFRLHEEEPTSYYGDLLWPILMLELWHCRHVDAEGAR